MLTKEQLNDYYLYIQNDIEEIEHGLFKDYLEDGENFMMWSDGINKKYIKDFTDEELKEWISKNKSFNEVYNRILNDALLKRRINKINKIKERCSV